MPSTKSPHALSIGSFNVLSSGLQDDGFISVHHDAYLWQHRRHRLVDILANMFDQGCHVIVTQENDHFCWILHELQQVNPLIHGIFVPKVKKWGGEKNISDPKFASTSRKQILKDKNPSLRTFADEYADAFAAVYTNDGDVNGMYNSDDGIGVYFIANSMDEMIIDEDLEEMIFDDANGYRVFVNRVQSETAVFIGTYNNVVIAGAHFPGGHDKIDDQIGTRVHAKIASYPDSSNKAVDRMDVMKYILDKQPDIIAADTNSGRHYDFNSELEALYDRDGYIDAVFDHGYECLKMRDMSGGQPDKMAEFTFDKIDRILYSNGKKAIEHIPNTFDIYGTSPGQFKLYDPDMSTIFEAIFKEKILNNICRKSNWMRNNIPQEDLETVIGYGPAFPTGVTVLDVITEMYPQNSCPSDHPPVVATFNIPHYVNHRYVPHTIFDSLMDFIHRFSPF